MRRALLGVASTLRSAGAGDCAKVPVTIGQRLASPWEGKQVEHLEAGRLEVKRQFLRQEIANRLRLARRLGTSELIDHDEMLRQFHRLKAWVHVRNGESPPMPLAVRQ